MRLIDAHTLQGIYQTWITYLGGTNHKEACKAVEECYWRVLAQPTIDASEVVRCKDCVFKDIDGYCGCQNRTVQPLDFCGGGQRKEDDDESTYPAADDGGGDCSGEGAVADDRGV